MTMKNSDEALIDLQKMEFRTITFNYKDKIATITLNRPEVYNALNREMIRELAEVLDAIQNINEIRVIIITGGEKVFAAGADISELQNLTPVEAGSFSFNNTFEKIEKLKIPVIAAIAGHALGGGLELALACDLRICSKSAKLGLPEIKLGVFPGAGGTQRLPRLIGSARAKEMIFFGEIIDGDTPLQYGLCSKIVETDSLLQAAETMAKKLATGPKVALGLAKQAIDNGMNCDLNTGLNGETIAWSRLFSTHDQKEGVTAFLEKRKPAFLGK